MKSIKWFNTIVEMDTPYNIKNMAETINKATSYVIIDPEEARGVLESLNYMYDFNFETEGLYAGQAFVWDSGEARFVRFDKLIFKLVSTYNSTMTMVKYIVPVHKAKLSFT